MRIIKILTDKDAKGFNRAAPKHEIVMAVFFMVNCPACEAFKPEWKKFVNSCESEGDPNVLIAEIDSNQASRVNFDTSTLGGFPTVYRDVKGEEGVVEFKHERTKKALRRFLKEAMAAKGGGKKRKTKKKRIKKRKTKKRRKSRRKKKKGGDQSHCVQASYNPPTKSQEEGDAYCLKYGEHGKTKCDINTGRCKSAPRPLPANIRYIDPRDILPPSQLRRTQHQRRSSSDPLAPSHLHRSPAFRRLASQRQEGAEQFSVSRVRGNHANLNPRLRAHIAAARAERAAELWRLAHIPHYTKVNILKITYPVLCKLADILL